MSRKKELVKSVYAILKPKPASIWHDASLWSAPDGAGIASQISKQLQEHIPVDYSVDEITSEDAGDFVVTLTKCCFDTYYNTCSRVEELTQYLCEQYRDDDGLFLLAVSCTLDHYDRVTNPVAEDVSWGKRMITMLCGHGGDGQIRAQDLRSLVSNNGTDTEKVQSLRYICASTPSMESSLLERIRVIGEAIFPEMQWRQPEPRLYFSHL